MKVETRGLRVRHSPEVDLRYPDLSVGSGEHVVVVGPSGSGKTTLLHLVPGLLVPQGGEVLVGGRRIDTLSEGERDAYRATSVGIVFQDFHLMPGYGALDNVVLGLGLAGVRGGAAVKRAREVLTDLGLGARLSHPPRRLSTGERQRVALARAVAHRPALLLADEPTAHLDPSRASDAVALLRSTAASIGATLVVVSHDPAVVSGFDSRVRVGARPDEVSA
ncbi:ABC transporter ATP-binding protein [Deinococcus pimensis]|uniref:ABC transporter ATP-binding protein n=1 Tax=Deinococcus pimensis TaxID=309888 RepID=UPI0006946E41|nr:ABC transporter ATP-binding protein [Deinococcus pimensis]